MWHYDQFSWKMLGPAGPLVINSYNNLIYFYGMFAPLGAHRQLVKYICYFWVEFLPRRAAQRRFSMKVWHFFTRFFWSSTNSWVKFMLIFPHRNLFNVVEFLHLISGVYTPLMWCIKNTGLWYFGQTGFWSTEASFKDMATTK